MPLPVTTEITHRLSVGSSFPLPTYSLDISRVSGYPSAPPGLFCSCSTWDLFLVFISFAIVSSHLFTLQLLDLFIGDRLVVVINSFAYFNLTNYTMIL